MDESLLDSVARLLRAELQPIKDTLDKLEKGQQSLTEGQEKLEQGQERLLKGQEKLDKGQGLLVGVQPTAPRRGAVRAELQ